VLETDSSALFLDAPLRANFSAVRADRADPHDTAHDVALELPALNSPSHRQHGT
jgi:hypothetical protein